MASSSSSSKKPSINMPVTLELPEESVRQDDLLNNFPELAEKVKDTEGLLNVRVDTDRFDERIFKKHLDSGFSDAYDTRGLPRGLCLIISNRKFARHGERIGTDVDCENLRSLFDQLGYRVTVEKDQRADQMKTKCQDFILNPEHENYSSCVLVLLSHGTMGKLLGSDSKPVDEKADILSHFNRPECKLVGKPKLVIIQACRIELAGKNKQTQHPDEEEDGPGQERDEYLDMVDRMHKLNYKDSGFVENSLTPDFADLLIAHSTLPGYVSWRHKEHGSWFVQAIVQIVSRNFHDEHIADMLVQVNRLISQVFGQNSRSQMPCPINHLRRKFFFFPNKD